MLAVFTGQHAGGVRRFGREGGFAMPPLIAGRSAAIAVEPPPAPALDRFLSGSEPAAVELR